MELFVFEISIMAPLPLRNCTKEECPPTSSSPDLTFYCYCCKGPMHWKCYEMTKPPEEIFISDNIKMICDDCLTNPREASSPKRKQPTGLGSMVQRTLDIQNATITLSKSIPSIATPPKIVPVKQNQQLQNIIESLVQKIETQTSTIAGLQVSVDAMNGAVNQNTAAIGESIKESRSTYADVAKKGFFTNGTPRLTKSGKTPKTSNPLQTPKASNPSQTPKTTKAVATGTSANFIGKPLSPPKPKSVARPKPERAIWLSRIHRDTTEDELFNYIKGTIGIEPTDVCKLVKKGRDISTYSFVSFRIGCTQANFQTLSNPMYWPSNSQIREFELEREASTGVKLNKASQEQGTPKNAQSTPNDKMDTSQVAH